MIASRALRLFGYRSGRSRRDRRCRRWNSLRRRWRSRGRVPVEVLGWRERGMWVGKRNGGGEWERNDMEGEREHTAQAGSPG